MFAVESVCVAWLYFFMSFLMKFLSWSELDFTQSPEMLIYYASLFFGLRNESVQVLWLEGEKAHWINHGSTYI